MCRCLTSCTSVLCYLLAFSHWPAWEGHSPSAALAGARSSHEQPAKQGHFDAACTDSTSLVTRSAPTESSMAEEPVGSLPSKGRAKRHVAGCMATCIQKSAGARRGPCLGWPSLPFLQYGSSTVQPDWTSPSCSQGPQPQCLPPAWTGSCLPVCCLVPLAGLQAAWTGSVLLGLHLHSASTAQCTSLPDRSGDCCRSRATCRLWGL